MFGDKVELTDQRLVYGGTAQQIQDSSARLIRAAKGHIINQGMIRPDILAGAAVRGKFSKEAPFS